MLQGLNRPHGLDLYDGWLYVAETDAIGRIRFDEGTGQTSGALERIVTGLPAGGNHWTRTVRVGPDGWMYVAIGSSCNVCIEKDRRRAAILRYRPDGSGVEVFATGLRNSVGLDFRPGTGELYATDNGRDLLGDDFPPCEFNRIERGGFLRLALRQRQPGAGPGSGPGPRGTHSGLHSAGLLVPRPQCAAGLHLPARRGPARGPARGGPGGAARIVEPHAQGWVQGGVLHFGADGKVTQRDFLTGFLRDSDQDVIGRPVDVAEGPDGAIYVSDDYTGSIYRVAYGERGAAEAPAVLPVARPQVIGPTAAASVQAMPEAGRKEQGNRGAQLFQKWACAGCHVPGHTTPGVVVHPLAGVGRRYSLMGLTDYFLAPIPPMPAFPLAPEERHDLAVHVAATYP